MVELVSHGARDRRDAGDRRTAERTHRSRRATSAAAREWPSQSRLWTSPRDRMPHLSVPDGGTARLRARLPTRADRSRLIVLSTQAPSSAARVQTAMKATSTSDSEANERSAAESIDPSIAGACSLGGGSVYRRRGFSCLFACGHLFTCRKAVVRGAETAGRGSRVSVVPRPARERRRSPRDGD